MKSFEYFQNTRIAFGSGQVEKTGEIVKNYGKKCLLVTTSKGGVLDSLYSRVLDIVANEGIEVAHFDGVHPNPTIEDVRKGAAMARDMNAEVILGLGGWFKYGCG